jgi:hypothetical protein
MNTLHKTCFPPVLVMVGLWVKADGKTAFDDFSPRPISGD